MRATLERVNFFAINFWKAHRVFEVGEFFECFMVLLLIFRMC
jgi:hypothetical protein